MRLLWKSTLGTTRDPRPGHASWHNPWTWFFVAGRGRSWGAGRSPTSDDAASPSCRQYSSVSGVSGYSWLLRPLHTGALSIPSEQTHLGPFQLRLPAKLAQDGTAVPPLPPDSLFLWRSSTSCQAHSRSVVASLGVDPSGDIFRTARTFPL
ncbi:hypothetical protein VTK73DRAFT_3861 [Phialemonium thermophilum]|uniref:Uncharacterized protein n=1 Tax=Phialemonium thermophilum TaxID=223376 RepID=A0ABR3VEV4_9PEZI